MLFSDHFNILYTSADEWFDPVLTVDTKLFVDPFKIFKDGQPGWEHAHDRVVAHFQEAFDLLADAGLDPKSLGYKSALRMMQFPEPSETCLGYTSVGTGGSGGGKGLARLIVWAMCDAIARGYNHLRHFEQLGILNEGIGPDRISDITCTILKPELVAYTQRLSSERGVPLHQHTLRAGEYDPERHGFVNSEVLLPTNPATGQPVLLVPKRFLRDLPAINANDWWEATRATELRDELNADIVRKVRKRDIVAAARRQPDKVAAWVRLREDDAVDAYDLERDPNGVYQWSRATKRYVRENPLKLDATTPEEFAAVIELIIGRFKHYLEQNGGWKLLWDGDKEKPEEAAQLIFLGIAKAYCEANGIVVDREVELGRGPVDFKFSSGFEHRALLEVKKLESGKFWNGLEAQLPSYLGSDGHRLGWYLAVRFREEGISEERAERLGAEVKRVAKKRDLDLRFGLVDVRRKTSASKLTAADLDEEIA